MVGQRLIKIEVSFFLCYDLSEVYGTLTVALNRSQIPILHWQASSNALAIPAFLFGFSSISLSAFLIASTLHLQLNRLFSYHCSSYHFNFMVYKKANVNST